MDLFDSKALRRLEIYGDALLVSDTFEAFYPQVQLDNSRVSHFCTGVAAIHQSEHRVR